MVVDQNSFIQERPFFANKNFTLAKLSRTPCLSFADPMLGNASYEDSFITFQIAPADHFLTLQTCSITESVAD
jgi:hypothetical protein